METSELHPHFVIVYRELLNRDKSALFPISAYLSRSDILSFRQRHLLGKMMNGLQTADAPPGPISPGLILKYLSDFAFSVLLRTS
jgi:hypothetical protein